MADLPQQYRTPLVNRNAPRGTPEQITIRVAAMLSHYYQPTISDEEYRLMMADWRDALRRLPWSAVELAIRDRIASPDRSRPHPGEIKNMALGKLEPLPRPQLEVVKDEALTPEQLEQRAERATKLMKEHGFGHLSSYTPGPLYAIMKAASAVTGVSIQEMKGVRRNKEACHARYHCWRIARSQTSMSFAQIGRYFGDRDNSTVVSGVANAEGLMETDPEFAAQHREIEKRLSD